MSKKIRAPFWSFHPRIFLEGIRQLKTIGILFTVVMCIAGIVSPISKVLSIHDMLQLGKEIPRQLVTLPNIHPIIVAQMFTMAPLATLIIFHFLDKRNSSDFYHALPINRSALFISLFSAVVAWEVFTLAASTAVSVLTTLCFPSYLQLDFSSILPWILSSLSGSLLITSCFALAVCITGTLFNNILVALIIMIVPRLLMTYINNILTDTIAVLPYNVNNPFLDSSYNIPIGWVSKIGNGSSYTDMMSWQSIVYTAIIALLIFAIAVVLFRIRKSEAAGNAASTPLLQSVYRLIITFLVTLIPIYLIFECVIEDSFGMTELFVVLVLYLIAAIAFCVYELITTKSAKRLLKAIPTFAIVLVLDAVLLGGLAISRHAILAYLPAPADIDTISLQYLSGRNNDYFSEKSSTIPLSDHHIAELVSTRLKQSVKTNSLYSVGFKDGGEIFIVSICQNGITRQRQMVFSNSEIKTILQVMSENSEYQSIYTLPARSHQVMASHYLLSQEDVNAVYDSIRRESTALTFQQRFQLLALQEYPASRYVFTNISLNISLQGKVYSISLPLSADYFPESYDLYLARRTDSTANNRQFIRESLKSATAETFMKDLHIEVYSNASAFYLDTVTLSPTKFESLLIDATPTRKDNFCVITYYPPDGSKPTQAFFKLEDDSIDYIIPVDD